MAQEEAAEYFTEKCGIYIEGCNITEVEKLKPNPSNTELEYVRTKEGRLLYSSGGCVTNKPCDVYIQTLK